MPEEKIVGKLADGRKRTQPIKVTWEWVEVSKRTLNKFTVPMRTTIQQIRRVEGSLIYCETKDRDKPPRPASGKILTHTSYDKGHLIALQLGGVDHKLNIVPQCRYWQQSGQWRQEVEVLILNRFVKNGRDYQYYMTVDCQYGRDPTNPWFFHVKVENDLWNNTLEFDAWIKSNWSDEDFERFDAAFEPEYEYYKTSYDGVAWSMSQYDRDVLENFRQSMRKQSRPADSDDEDDGDDKSYEIDEMDLNDESDDESDDEMDEEGPTPSSRGYALPPNPGVVQQQKLAAGRKRKRK